MPRQRHAKIFQFVNKLAPGASLILVNDHESKPIYYQFEKTWRIETGRLAAAVVKLELVRPAINRER